MWAWDLGVAGLSRSLSAQLDAFCDPAQPTHTGFDPNRPLEAIGLDR